MVKTVASGLPKMATRPSNSARDCSSFTIGSVTTGAMGSEGTIETRRLRTMPGMTSVSWRGLIIGGVGGCAERSARKTLSGGMVERITAEVVEGSVRGSVEGEDPTGEVGFFYPVSLSLFQGLGFRVQRKLITIRLWVIQSNTTYRPRY